MATNYAKHVSKQKTPQSEPIPGEPQVENNAGGYVYQLTPWEQLDRFLVLGCEGSTYYVEERPLTIENAKNVFKCLAEDYGRALNRIVEVSDKGLAPKQDPAIFALACAFTVKDQRVQSLARQALLKVCRTGSHLFSFVAAAQELRGWGPSLKRAVAGWYTEMPIEKLAYQVAKYQQRNGWSHRDILRLSHPKAKDEARNDILRWVIKGKDSWKDSKTVVEAHDILHALDAIQAADKSGVIDLIVKHELPRECVPSQWLTDPEVQRAMLPHMPLTALIRNLGNLSKSGVLKDLSAEVDLVCSKLTDVEYLRKSRVHPIQMLSALMVYGSGMSVRGNSTWTPVQQIVQALNDGFYLAFQAVEPTGKRIMIALDVSGSMGGGEIAGIPGLSPRVASAAMALVTSKVEKRCMAVTFSDGQDASGGGPSMHPGYAAKVSPFDLGRHKSVEDVIRATENLQFGGTDCALPILHALERGLEVDAWIVYTDSETWAGNVHPKQALDDYRKKTGIDSKLIVVGMTATEFTILDPQDRRGLNCVGFDSSAPALIGSFIRG